MKTKKIMIVIFILCLAAGAVLLWRNFYQSPELAVKAYLDAIFKENGAETKEEEANLANLFMTKIQETQLACALENPREHQEDFWENIKGGLMQVNYEVSETERSGEEAEAEVAISYFKLEEIAKNAQKTLQEDLKEEDSMTTEQMIEKLYKIIGEEFQKGPVRDGKIKMTVTLHKKNHKWEVDDQFENEIFDAILQQ